MKPTRVCISNFAPALLTSTIPISPSSTHRPSRTIASTRSSTPSPLQPLAVSWAMISAASASARSEERRVGKECVSRVDLGGRCISKKKKQQRKVKEKRNEEDTETNNKTKKQES